MLHARGGPGVRDSQSRRAFGRSRISIPTTKARNAIPSTAAKIKAVMFILFSVTRKAMV